MERSSEIEYKQSLVSRYLERHQLDGVYLASVPNFAWFSAGGDSHVENHSKYGVASFLVTKSKRFLLTNNIELQRMIRKSRSSSRLLNLAFSLTMSVSFFNAGLFVNIQASF